MQVKQPGRFLKVVLSVFLVYQLVGVVLAPNTTSFLTFSVASLYKPYMNFLNLNHSWGFFAPEPISPPLYIDYVLEQKNGLAISGRFPDENNPYFFRDRHNRRMSLSKFIVSSDDNLNNMFVRYLCLNHPDTSTAKLWKVTAIQPSLEMVQKGEKKMTDAVDYKIEVLGTFYCPEKP